jgi:curved DNA-binding protein CbpA
MREKQRTLSQATLYELLDVEPGATPEAIKAAYFRLAKGLHPDHRAGLKIEDPEGILDDLYLRVKDAYEVLSNEAERRLYDFRLAQKAEKEAARLQPTAAAHPAPRDSRPAAPARAPTKTFTSSQTARIHFGNGERFFADGRYHEAIEELRTAVRLDPTRADYHRALGKALAKNPKWRKQAEGEFSKALEINRFDADSYLSLGELYLEGGLETRAKKMFEEALAVDPDNVRALERLSRSRNDGSTFARLKGIMRRSRSQ